jgi:exocyst complex component 4
MEISNILPALLGNVQLDWKQTIYEDSNPLDIALPLLDTTSVGLAHRRGEFLELKDRISNGLKLAVNEHFQSFNESIGSYRSIVNGISGSQAVVDNVKENVQNTVEFLNEKDPNSISQLNDNLKTYNDMIAILDAIDDLKTISKDVENEISAKNYSKAQSLLHKAAQAANKFNLWELPALGNLKEFFEVQEGQLFEILVEELHNVIYSKKLFDTFNTHSIDLGNKDGVPYSTIEKYLIDSIDIDISDSAHSSQARVEEFVSYLMKSTTSELNDEENELSEINMLDETNPFNQILSILSILHNQGKLQLALNILIERIATELNQLINRVVEDTKVRHAKIIKSLNSITLGSSVQSHMLTKLSTDNYSSTVIQDLFWSFFKKLLFLKQCIKVIVVINQKFEVNNPDVSHFILKREDQSSNPALPEASTIDLMKLWKVVQVEIKNLILTYVSMDDSSSSVTFNPTTTRQPNSLFQFYHVDYNNDHTVELKSVLQDLFPGFINSNDLNTVDSPYIEDNKFLKQSKIIPPSILHMRYILEPFLLFIQGLTLLVPEFEDDPLKFFNDFMSNEFLPLLEEAFTVLYIADVEEKNSLEIFEFSNLDISHYENFELQSTSPNETTKTTKVFKFFAEFKMFLNNVCFILNTSLQFRKEFSSIIFKILSKFEDKVEELYQDLYNELLNYLETDREVKAVFQNPNRKLSSTMIQKTSINKIELRNSKVYYNFRVLQNSMKLMLELLNNHLIKTIDLNKTDLNLTKIEKLRKNWSFFEIISIKNDLFNDNESTALSFDNVNKVILNDELKVKYDDIVSGFKTIDTSVAHITNMLEQVLDIV